MPDWLFYVLCFGIGMPIGWYTGVLWDKLVDYWNKPPYYRD